MRDIRLITCAGIVVLLLMLGTPVLNAAQNEPSEAILNTLLSAIASNNYDHLAANATPALRARITRQSFDQVSTQLAPRLNRGYSLLYLANLRQQGVDVLLWKVVFQDGGDDMLLRVVIQDGKIAGLWFQ